MKQFFSRRNKSKELMCKNHRNLSVFASLVGISIGIVSSELGLKVYAIRAGIKRCNSIVKKKRKRHDKNSYETTSWLKSFTRSQI